MISRQSFRLESLAKWKVFLYSILEDDNVKWTKLEENIKKYQDPKEVDKL